jgi:hypothetical protein
MLTLKTKVKTILHNETSEVLMNSPVGLKTNNVKLKAAVGAIVR